MHITIAETFNPSEDYLGRVIYDAEVSHSLKNKTDKKYIVWDSLLAEDKAVYVEMAKALWDFAEKYKIEPLINEINYLRNPPSLTVSTLRI